MDNLSYIGLITGIADAGRPCSFLSLSSSKNDMTIFDLGAPCNDFLAMHESQFEYGVFWRIETKVANKIKRHLHFLARASKMETLRDIRDIEQEAGRNFTKISQLLTRYDVPIGHGLFNLMNIADISHFVALNTTHEGVTFHENTLILLNRSQSHLDQQELKHSMGKILFPNNTCKPAKLII